MDEFIDSPSRARCLARFVLAVGAVGVCMLLVILGRPVYWKVYATVIDPFEDPEVGKLILVTPGDQPVLLRKDAAKTGQPPANQGQTSAVVPPTTTGQPSSNAHPPPLPPPFPAPTSSVFNPDDPNFKLTKERAAQLAQEGYLMVTWANKHYTDFALSWAHNIRKAGITGYLVGAMDDEILKVLVDSGINTWRMNSGLSKKDFGWGSPEFRKMGKSKIRLILDTLLTGQSIIISDIDTAWLRNPIPFLNKYKEADCLTSSDLLHNSVPGEELERFPDGVGPASNIGIMLFRNASLPLVEAWVNKVETEDVWDQSAFNDLYRIDMKGDTNDPKHLFTGYQGKVKMGILPVSLFASGHTFFVQRMGWNLGMVPFVGHATFQYSGTPGKRHRFREFLLWHDPPSYFDHAKGFISFKMDIPQELLDQSAVPPGRMLDTKCIEGHFKLMNHQLVRLRNAFALATLTGRALILPELWCGADKYWAPLESGRIPGTHFKLPFICPADHVLNMEGGMEIRWPLQEYGPHIEWREYSFLHNERLSAAVNNSRVFIEVCANATTGCADGKAPAAVVQDKKLKLAPSLTSKDLLQALKSAEQYKILEFSSMEKAFGNFSEEADWVMFARRMSMYGTTFCCLEKEQPSWIWYDFQWDIPHTDRFHRKFDTWRWVFGDN